MCHMFKCHLSNQKQKKFNQNGERKKQLMWKKWYGKKALNREKNENKTKSGI